MGSIKPVKALGVLAMIDDGTCYYHPCKDNLGDF
jgi:hypothetical protein